jgi:ABC-2 type transport system permease protein
MNWLRFAERLGAFLVRVAILGVFGLGIRFVLNCGLLGGAGLSLLCGLFTAFVAAMLNVIFSAMLGLSAFVFEDPGPVYWLWQKLGFAFGGLMFPLDLYPDTLRHIAGATPFPSLLEAPGRMPLGTDFDLGWQAGFVLVGWLGVVILTAQLTRRCAPNAFRPDGS